MTEIIYEQKLFTDEFDFNTKEDMANDTVLWNFTHMRWKGTIYKVTGDYAHDGRGVRNIVMTLLEDYKIVDLEDEKVNDTSRIVLIKDQVGYGIYDELEKSFIGLIQKRGSGVPKTVWAKIGFAKSAFKQHTGTKFDTQRRYTVKPIGGGANER